MSDASLPLMINGRFLTQPFSGVQRFAEEITRALVHRLPRHGHDQPIILVPAETDAHGEFGLQLIGRLGGQAWEQVDLARFARRGTLLNLGNTAPLLQSNQLVVLHDAGTAMTPFSYSKRFRLWYWLLHTLLVRSRTRLVTVSEFSRQELAGVLRVPPERIAVIGEGADHIVRQPPDRSILERHGLTPGNFALAVGNLSRHKNLAALGPAARTLEAAGKSLVVIGCGEAPIFNVETNLPQPAIYVGRISDAELRALYENALCLLFPSFYEGFGLPVGEAMLCGCPVVASDIGALRELCSDAALFASPFAPEEFARAVTVLMEQPQLRAQAIARGREVATRLTWSTAVDRLMPHIEALLSG